MRKKGIPPQIQPALIDTSQRPEGSKDDDICHLIGISMDKYGKPVSLFTTNRWVTGETWYAAADVIQLIDYFNIDHSFPSWPVNLWLSSMVRVYRDEIMALIHERDQNITAWQTAYPEKNPYEDRLLEVTSSFMLSSHKL